MVGTSQSSGIPFIRTRWPEGIKPVKSEALEGIQQGFVTYALDRLVLWAANASMFGVCTTGCPA